MSGLLVLPFCAFDSSVSWQLRKNRRAKERALRYTGCRRFHLPLYPALRESASFTFNFQNRNSLRPSDRLRVAFSRVVANFDFRID